MSSVNNDRWIRFKIEALINGETSFNSLIEIGSRRHADLFYKLIIEVNSERLIGEKESK